jgi:chromosome segregation ATPase
MGSGGTPQSMDQVKKNLQKGAISNDIQNKQFIQSTMETSGPNLAISKKLDEADKRFNALKEQVVQTNDMSIQKLRNDYESKIKNWTSDYKKSIQAYKEYIANQAKHLSEVEQYNKSIEQQLKRNETERLTLSNKWNECQSKINRHERELLQSSSSDKQIIKELEAKLKKEKGKQGNLDTMMTRLREEKEKLDQAYENNMQKLKAGGLGNNCPKGFNMNDYILKKNIPCWGCIL